MENISGYLGLLPIINPPTLLSDALFIFWHGYCFCDPEVKMIDTVSYLNSITAAAKDSQGSSSSSKTNEMGKDQFMQLLINQLSHQDPLEPMDNTQFVAQLAQFSSLEQMQNIASAVQTLALSQAASTNSQMVSLIGKRVIVPGSEFSYDSISGQSVDIKFNLEGDSVPLKLMITDSKGNVVRSMDITNCQTGSNDILFDGKDDNGKTLETGNYTYKIVGHDGNAVSGLTTYSNYIVDAVAFNGSNTELKSKGASIDVADIIEVIKN